MPRFLAANRIIFDQEDFLAGLHPQYNTGTTTVPVPRGVSGLNEAKAMNPFRSFGYAYPGANATNATNVSTILNPLFNMAVGVESSTDYMYAIGGDKYLYRATVATPPVVSNTGSWPHQIDANASGWDVCSYPALNTRNASIFYSWNNTGANWDVGRFDNAAGTFTDNFMSTQPATPLSASGNTKPHPMIVGDFDRLYMGDGNLLHMYDAADTSDVDGKFTSSVLTIPSGYIITCFARMSPYLVIFAYFSRIGNTLTVDTVHSGPAKAFFWDYLSQDPTYVRDLNDNVVTSAVEYNGSIACFTAGSQFVSEINTNQRISRLRLWNGSIFEPVAQNLGNPPMFGGAEVVGNSIQWNSQGQIYSYKSPVLGFDAGLNYLGKGSGTSAGVLKTVGGLSGFQLISTGSTTTGGMQYMNRSEYDASADFSTQEAVPTFAKGEKGNVQSVKVAFAKTASGGRDFSLFLKDQSGNIKQLLNSVTTIDSTNIIREYYEDINGNDIDFLFQSLSIVGIWAGGIAASDAPGVKYVEIDFETINIE